MKFTKNNSLIVSEKFFEKLEKRLENASDNLSGYYKTFNNCLQQGLMLEIYEGLRDSELLIWACEYCNNIMVVLADKSCSNINDMFDDKALESAKNFALCDYDKVVDYAYNVIKKQFGENFKEEYNTKFKMHKCLVDLQKIALDSKELDYEDYYDLATFEDVEQLYFCDLIIMDGKLGLRYSKYFDSYCENFDNLSFEEWEPDLSSNMTLMLGMQERLNSFIENKKDYEFTIGIGV